MRESGAPRNEASAAQSPSDITISDNSFRNAANPAIDVVVGEGVVLSNNKITSAPAVAAAPGPAVRLSAGSRISVNGLTVGPAKDISAAVEIGCGVHGIDPSRWTIQSAAAPALLDRKSQCR